MKILILILLLSGCHQAGWEEGCENDKTFKPHIVKHHHKSKEYNYYHNTACDCISIKDDLERDSRNYILYYK